MGEDSYSNPHSVESTLRIRFRSRHLKALYYEEKGAHRYEKGVVNAFFEVMAVVEGAVDERDLRALKGLRYHKLKGKRKHQYGIHLNGPVCLIVEWEEDSKGKRLQIVDIEDYH
jgi:proteic killer suppression protein